MGDAFCPAFRNFNVLLGSTSPVLKIHVHSAMRAADSFWIPVEVYDYFKDRDENHIENLRSAALCLVTRKGVGNLGVPYTKQETASAILANYLKIVY
jgi:hypothetical protein